MIRTAFLVIALFVPASISSGQDVASFSFVENSRIVGWVESYVWETDTFEEDGDLEDVTLNLQQPNFQPDQLDQTLSISSGSSELGTVVDEQSVAGISQIVNIQKTTGITGGYSTTNRPLHSRNSTRHKS